MVEPAHEGRRPQLLFASYHCYLDPSSGAALSARHLLELLVGRGWNCRVLCGPLLDYQQERPLTALLDDPNFHFGDPAGIRRRNGTAAGTPFTLHDVTQDGVPVVVFDTPGTHSRQVPSRADGQAFLALLGLALEQSRPQLLLTYGGFWLAQPTLDLARRAGVPVVFWLHNCAYQEAELFRHVQGVLVPSEFARDHYRRSLGLATTALPPPFDWERVRCDEVRGRYVTFVNPEPNKGVFPFARIATEVARRRPDIPLLVVEGRGTVSWLKAAGLDFDALGNLHVMANTPDPRAFYRVSRMVLMPSLWQETFGRVAAEAFSNGIPVLASRRGGLPEVLEDAGFLLDIPDRYTPETHVVPRAEEMAPWVDTILRLWDDDALHAAESQRCRAAAEVWRPERLVRRYQTYLATVAGLPVPEEPAPSVPVPTPTPPAPAVLPARAPAAPAQGGPDISIVMPVYNGAAFLERAIHSILAQTFGNWELLVVDDGSQDDSYERVCRLAAEEGRIRPFRLPENQGPGAARNHALRQARAVTIAYLDCDDEYYPDYLARVHAWHKRGDVLVFRYDQIEERPGSPNFGRTFAYRPAEARHLLYQQNIVIPLGVAHARALLDRVGLFNETIYVEQDWDLWKRFHQAGAVFYFADSPSGLYHIRSTSQSRTHHLPEAVRNSRTAADVSSPPSSSMEGSC